MDNRSNKVFLIPILAVLFVMISYQYICPAGSNSCQFRVGEKFAKSHLKSTQFSPSDDFYRDQELEDEYPLKFLPKFNFSDRDLLRHEEFNFKGDDVIVFLHIQKTGGTTFGRHLVRNIPLEKPCDCKPGQKRCTCHRPGKKESWLFSRFSTGWSSGLHADWTQLTNCVPLIMEKKEAQKNRRNFYYITLLRDPVSRYLSEWKHMQRGATWKTSLHMCDGRSPTQDELPTCYQGDDWSGVALSEFMDCPSNLANNRQVRMLADLSLVGCYNLSSMKESERSRTLLSSAKANLKSMAFYGLTEFQRKTQYLFERTFHLHFISAFTEMNSTRTASINVAKDIRCRIEALNGLDVQLYDFAKDLFLQRVQFSQEQEHHDERLQRHQERCWLREHWAFLSQHRWEKEEATTPLDYGSQVVPW